MAVVLAGPVVTFDPARPVLDAGAVYLGDDGRDLDAGGWLHPGLIGVHAAALPADDFRFWQHQVTAVDPGQKGTVVWSPFSNLWLYARTTDVVAAHEAGLRIALGSDWSPSGTKHVLGELKVADALNEHAFGRHCGDRELCEMVTANPGDALAVAWGRRSAACRPAARPTCSCSNATIRTRTAT